MAATPKPITINSLRGGMNDTDPPHTLPDDQCVLAENVEFFYSALGERRLGCEAADMAGSGIHNEHEVVYLTERFPTNDIKSPEYWAIGATVGTSVTVSRGTFGNWVDVTPADPILTASPDIYEIDSVSLHGNMFVAYHSTVDRMHVWDGVSLRRSGLAEPAAPAAPTNTGVGAYAAIGRYYRVRYSRQVAGVTVLKSEPSDPTALFTPSGTGTGVVVARPALLGESETHWILEVSLNGADYYILSTNTIATTSYTDSTVTTAYADGELSEDIGTYLLLPSARFLSIDQNRLLLASHWTDVTKQCRIMWTPVFSDPSFVGNDERLPLDDTDNYVDLDTDEGGALTGFTMSSFGVGYAFKWGSVYGLIRTGDATRAYDAITISHSRGAIPGSLVDGIDATGGGCVYFLDPVYGPSRIGPGGLETIRGFRRTWQRVNTAATTIAARGVYYPSKQQVHWWVAADGSDTPSLKFVLQIDSVQEMGTGAGTVSGRGWSIATGRITQIRSVAVFTESVILDGMTSLSARPFIGLTTPDYVQRCDTQDTDAGQSYVAKIRTRPYLIAGLLQLWGVMRGTVLAASNLTQTLKVKCIRDYGVETNIKTIDLLPTMDEETVIKDIDDLVMSGATAVQFEFEDGDAPVTADEDPWVQGDWT